jgi:hypothetical protein
VKITSRSNGVVTLPDALPGRRTLPLGTTR